MEKLSTLWSTIRYAVTSIGSFVVGLGWATSFDWASFLAQFDVLIGAVSAAVAAAVGIISRWNLIAVKTNKMGE